MSPDTVPELADKLAQPSVTRSEIVDNSAGTEAHFVDKLSPDRARRRDLDKVSDAGNKSLPDHAKPPSRLLSPRLMKSDKRSPAGGAAPARKSKRTPPPQGLRIRSTPSRLWACQAANPFRQKVRIMDAREFLQRFAHFGGFDFAREIHHIVVVDREGQVVLNQPLPETAQDWAKFREAAKSLYPLAVAIETNNGPAVERLLEMGVSLYPMNPKAAERLRDRKAPSGVKDDELDAWSFADGLRTDGHGWRMLAPEDERTKELRILCRDEISLIGQKTALVNALQAALVEYYPAALQAFEDWTMPATWSFVIQFATPELLVRRGKRKWENFLHAQKLYRPETQQRRLEIFAKAQEFANPSEAVTRAKSRLAVSLAKQLLTLETQLEEYRQHIQKLFGEHPDHDLFDSLPGIGNKTKARLLGEIGADPQRFESADALRAYAGSAPVTQQSGKSRVVFMRRACNKWLRNAMHWLADLSRGDCVWAATYYTHKREQGKSHAAALRSLAGRWQKILWKMIQTGRPYDAELHMQNMIRHGSWVVQLLPAAEP